MEGVEMLVQRSAMSEADSVLAAILNDPATDAERAYILGYVHGVRTRSLVGGSRGEAKAPALAEGGAA